MNRSKELTAAINAAKTAGKKVMAAYAKGHSEFSLKLDKTEVTKADLASNKAIIQSLAGTNIPIITEETPSGTTIPSGKVWVADPLDGTKDFISGSDDFSVMIGLLESNRPVLGVVFLPKSGELYFAEKGKGAYLESAGTTKKIHVSGTTDLSAAKVIASKHHFEVADSEFAKFINATDFVRKGSIGVKLGEIAAGNADIYWNFDGLSIWDICAPQAILEEAGGNVCDLSGNRLDYVAERFKHGIIATNGKCRDRLLGRITQFRAPARNY